MNRSRNKRKVVNPTSVRGTRIDPQGRRKALDRNDPRELARQRGIDPKMLTTRASIISHEHRQVQVRAEGAAEGETTTQDQYRIRACVTTDEPVVRFAWDPYEGDVEFHEILEISEKAINLERAGRLPLLLNHNQYDLDARRGYCENYSIEPVPGTDLTGLFFDVVLSDDEANRTIVERVDNGTLSDLSIGYFVRKYKKVTGQDDGDSSIEVLRAVRWDLHEASIVSVPADPNARFELRAAFAAISGGTKMPGMRTKKGDQARKQNANGGAPRGRSNGGNGGASRGQGAADDAGDDDDEDGDDDSDEDDEADDQVDGDDDADVEDEDDDVDGDDGERSAAPRLARRDRAIVALGRSLGAPQAFTQRYLGTGISQADFVRKFGERAIARAERARDAGNRNPTPFGRSVHAQPAGQGGRIIPARRALIVQAGVATARNQRAEGDAGNMGQMGLRAIARDVMRSHGIRPGEDVNIYDQLMDSRAVAPMVLGDFTGIVNQIAQNLTISAAEDVPYVGAGWTKEAEMANFLQTAGWLGSTFDPLERTLPGQEIPAKKIRNAMTLHRLDTATGRYPISRQFFESDIAGFLADYAGKIAIAARRADNGYLVDISRMNPATADDGIPFWHTLHNNVGENMPLTIENVAKAQRALSGNDLGLRGTILVYSPDLELQAAKVSTPTTPNDQNGINPYGGKLTVYPHFGLPEGTWILLLAPAIRPVFLHLLKQGRRDPVTRIFETSQFDGFEIVATDDKGASLGDYRGGFLAFVGEAPTELNSYDGQETFELDYGFED